MNIMPLDWRMPIDWRIGGSKITHLDVKMKAKGKQKRFLNEDMMEAWLKVIPKTCIHCGSIDGHKFLQMANSRTNQPRYKCKDCSKSFTHNGKACQSKRVKARIIKKSRFVRTLASMILKKVEDEQVEVDMLANFLAQDDQDPPSVQTSQPSTQHTPPCNSTPPSSSSINLDHPHPQARPKQKARKKIPFHLR